MKRRIDKWLQRWALQDDRDVLLVRGARQVGKTYSVRELGRSFRSFLEVNFEEHRAVHAFFEGDLTPRPICEKLAAYFGVSVVPRETLLFLDEIQACPNALSSLRFFREKMPDLHVAASGSLLQFAMEAIPSQGVGRVSSLYMYPLSFPEFLEALGEGALLPVVESASVGTPLDMAFHTRLIDRVRTFQLIGGMPRIVDAYVRGRDLIRCMELLDALLVTLRDDFSKYAKHAPVERLADVHDSVFYQAGAKFMYSRVDTSASTVPIRRALGMLVKAGLAIKVHHTAAQGLPLEAQAKASKFKVLPSDTGLMQRAMGTDLASMLVAGDADVVNKGALAEVLVGLELIRNSTPTMEPALHYWHRESRGSSAELDYVVPAGSRILPVEVKAGSSGKMRSMQMFLEERKLQRGVRVSLENFSQYGKIDTIPLYAAWTIA
jgi:predicted AAA+ superfamily ATPase